MFKVRARHRERDTPTQRHTDKDRKRERSSADIGRKGDWQRVEEPLLKILCEFISSKSDRQCNRRDCSERLQSGYFREEETGCQAGDRYNED